MTTTQEHADIEMQQLPVDLKRDGRTIRLRNLNGSDGNKLLEFGSRQPSEDLLYEERDITSVADVGTGCTTRRRGASAR